MAPFLRLADSDRIIWLMSLQRQTTTAPRSR